MKKENIVKLIALGIFVVVAIYFWPSYQKLRPIGSEQLHQNSLAEIANLSPQAPLSLIIEPEEGTTPLLKAINSAQKSVDLVIYDLEDQNFEQALAEAQSKGVAVRVILDNSNHFGRKPNQLAYDFFQTHQVQVKWSPSYFPLVHQKTLIIDNSQAIIMTFNLTPRYYHSGRDFAVIDNDPLDVNNIESVFDSDWNGSRIQADSNHDLVWSPGSADTILALINSASRSLDIYNEEMADQRITNALAKAAVRGVNVRIDMTYATNWKQAFQNLSEAKVNVRTYASTASLYIHTKVIIADHHKAFVGSENFSTQSLDFNRELGILISRADIIFSLEKTFNQDWAGSRPFGAVTVKSKKSAESGSLPAQIGQPSAPAGLIKLSLSGLCHQPGDAFYNQTKHFTAYNTLDDCLKAGGHLPVSRKKRAGP